MSLTEKELGDLVRRYYDRAFNHGEFDIVDEIANDDEPFVCDSNAGWAIEGVAGIKASISRQRHAFKDFTFTIDELFVDGKKVTLWWTATGIFHNRLLEYDPTGERLTFSGASLLLFSENDKLIGGRSAADLQEKLRATAIEPAAVPA